MRTTLTLDDHIERKLRKRAAISHKSFKVVTNELLQLGLDTQERIEATRKPFKVKAKSCGFRSGIDTEKLNQILDDAMLEDYSRE